LRAPFADRTLPDSIVSAYSQAVQAGRGLLHAISAAATIGTPNSVVEPPDFLWATQRAIPQALRLGRVCARAVSAMLRIFFPRCLHRSRSTSEIAVVSSVAASRCDDLNESC
jgi:hypothetical protein